MGLDGFDLVSLEVGLLDTLLDGESSVDGEATSGTTLDLGKLTGSAGTIGPRAAARLTVVVSQALAEISLLSVAGADVLGGEALLINLAGAEKPVGKTGNDDTGLLAPLPAPAFIAGVGDDDDRSLTREGLAWERLPREGLAGEGLSREGLSRLLRESRLPREGLAWEGLSGEWLSGLLREARLSRERLARLLGKSGLGLPWPAWELTATSKPASLLALIELGARPGADTSKVPVDGAALRLAIKVGVTGAADELPTASVANVLLTGWIRLNLSQNRSGDCASLD